MRDQHNTKQASEPSKSTADAQKRQTPKETTGITSTLFHNLLPFVVQDGQPTRKPILWKKNQRQRPTSTRSLPLKQKTRPSPAGRSMTENERGSAESTTSPAIVRDPYFANTALLPLQQISKRCCAREKPVKTQWHTAALRHQIVPRSQQYQRNANDKPRMNRARTRHGGGQLQRPQTQQKKWRSRMDSAGARA